VPAGRDVLADHRLLRVDRRLEPVLRLRDHRQQHLDLALGTRRDAAALHRAEVLDELAHVERRRPGVDLVDCAPRVVAAASASGCELERRQREQRRRRGASRASARDCC
jgi:hypothetical protein